jgi:hypothetical protein
LLFTIKKQHELSNSNVLSVLKQHSEEKYAAHTTNCFAVVFVLPKIGAGQKVCGAGKEGRQPQSQIKIPALVLEQKLEGGGGGWLRGVADPTLRVIFKNLAHNKTLEE